MKKLAIGCGIVLALIAAVIIGLIIAGPKLAQHGRDWFQQQMKAGEETAKFESNWTPPTPEPSEQWFPADVAGWKRTAAAPFDDLPELELKRNGFSGEYTHDGKSLTLKVVPVTELETEALSSRAAATKPLPENSGRMTTTVTLGKVREVSHGDEKVLTRTIGQWFILIHTINGAETRPFVDAWLHAIDTQPAAPAESPATLAPVAPATPAQTPDKPQ